MIAPGDALARFLLDAKRRTYAALGEDGSVAPVLTGTKQLEYRDGALLYRDVYAGMAYFAGQELVYDGDRPIWSMTYAGGVVPRDRPAPGAIYLFLRKALQHGTVAQPYRGPDVLRDGPYIYTNASEGSLEGFWGHELIRADRELVYELRYSGGLLR